MAGSADDAYGTPGESQGQDGRRGIAESLVVREAQVRSERIHLDHLGRKQPARGIEIMDMQVAEHATRAREVAQRWGNAVAAEHRKAVNRSDLALHDGPAGRCEAGVEAPLEAHLDDAPFSLDPLDHVAGFVQVEGQWLFGKGRYASRQTALDERRVTVGRRDD